MVSAFILATLGLPLNSVAEDRVERAYRLARPRLQELCEKGNIAYPPKRLYFRAFKQERILEIWASGSPRKPMQRLEEFPIAGMSGNLGPKRKEGDLQVPEGLYYIDRFNPQSRFRLSLGINYPNASDRIRSDKSKPGGDIFIHGDTKSIGCLAMTDEVIDQIYVLALEAKTAGQSQIPVHIFPFKLTERSLAPRQTSPWIEFWKELEPAYGQFERTRYVPSFKVGADGSYKFEKA